MATERGGKRRQVLRPILVCLGWMVMSAGLMAGCGGGGDGASSSSSGGGSGGGGGGGGGGGTVSLTVNKAGTGTGTVTSSPAGITCGTTCTANFSTGTAITLTATVDAGSTFGGWSGGGCTGTSSCSVTPTVATTVQAAFNASVGLSPNTLGLLVATSGGTRSDWLPDPGITLKSEDLYMALILPDAANGTIINETTSSSWASKTVESHVNDNRYFMVTRYYDTKDLNFQEYDLATRMQVGSSLGAYDRVDPFNMGFIGKKLYYAKQRTCDLFGCRGGEFRVLDFTSSSLPSPTTLLPFGDVNNVGETRSDQGVLYAISWVPSRLFIYKRNLTTGALGTPWRTVLFGDANLYETFWRFLVNEGVLYVVRQRIADKALVIHTIDVASATQSSGDPRLLFTFVPTGTVYYSTANVDHGYIAMLYQAAGNQRTTQVLLLDTRGTPIVPRFLEIGMDVYDVAVFFRD